MNEITQGLIVSAFGLGITFAALAFVILVINLLTRLFPTKPETTAEAKSVTAPAEALVSEEEAIAAAIAIALNQMRSASDHDELGSALESGHGAWWLVGRSTTGKRRTK